MLVAALAGEDAGAMLIVERARIGALGAGLAQDREGIGAKLLAPRVLAHLDGKMLGRFGIAASARTKQRCPDHANAGKGQEPASIGNHGHTSNSLMRSI